MKQRSKGRMRWAAALLTLALAWIAVVCAAKDVRAESGTVADPISLQLDGTYYQDTLTEEQWFKIEAPSTGKVTCTLNVSEGSGGGIQIYLYQKENLSSSLGELQCEDTTKSVAWNLSKGTYYVDMTLYYQCKQANYLIGWTFSDYGTTTQTITSQESPLDIALDQTVVSAKTSTDKVQWYRINLPNNGDYTFTYASECGNRNRSLYNHSMEQVQTFGWYDVNTTLSYTLDAGTYYIKDESANVGRYTFVVKQVSSNEPTVQLVTLVSLPKSKTVTAGNTFTLNATVSPSDAENKELHWESSNTNVATVNSSGFVETKAPGKVTITAKATDGSGKSGKCVVTVKPGKVSLSSVKSAAKGKLLVKWKKRSGVSGYQIQYAKNKKFSSAKTKKVKSSTASVTLKKQKSKSRIYVRVRAYKKVGSKIIYGAWSAKKSAKIK